jgi:chromosome segregation ATPase
LNANSKENQMIKEKISEMEEKVLKKEKTISDLQHQNEELEKTIEEHKQIHESQLKEASSTINTEEGILAKFASLPDMASMSRVFYSMQSFMNQRMYEYAMAQQKQANTDSGLSNGGNKADGVQTNNIHPEMMPQMQYMPMNPFHGNMNQAASMNSQAKSNIK